MFSLLNGKLYANPAAERIQMYAGIPEDMTANWKYTKVISSKELGEYHYWQQEGRDVSDIDFLIYTIETEELVQVYETISFEALNFMVRGLRYHLEKGELHCRCELQKKSGLMEHKHYPMHLIGVALFSGF